MVQLNSVDPPIEDTAELPISLRRAIWISSKFFPEEAQRLESTLQVLLRSRLRISNQQQAWNSSLLTEGGFPVELTFTSDNNSIRYTSEIGSPDVANHQRLALAVALLQEFGLKRINQQNLRFFQSIQQAGMLRYGAWIGVRHVGNKDQFKLYLEIPHNGQSIVENYLFSLLGTSVAIPNRPINMQMLGFYPETGEIEFYFQIISMTPWEIINLLKPVGLEDYQETILDLFAEAYGRPVFRQLPGDIFGFSYSLSLHRPPIFSFYTFAETLFSSNAHTRRSILALGRQNGWNMSYYAKFSELLVLNENLDNWHGMFGIVVVPKKTTPIIHIGLRPPEALATQ
ncbi:MAG: hypothetical protein AB4372_15925 [Xenococcus sp. (in: cyanobacteria)]